MASTALVPSTAGIMHRQTSSISSGPSVLRKEQEIHPLEDLQLAGWLVSADHAKRLKFLRKLEQSYYQPGEQIPLRLMNQPGTSGITGVWNTTVIPFRHLSQQF